MNIEHENKAQTLMLKNKIIFICFISFIIISLFLVCYLFFFRSTTIDVMKYVNLEYSGGSGSATVKITSDPKHLNQRIQEFLDTLTFTATPNSNLSNGTIIHVQASYSQTLAHKYNIKVENESKEFTVAGLSQRYENVNDINKEFLKQIDQNSESFIDKKMADILKNDFYDFYITSDTKLKEKQRIARVFLQGINNENKDKIIDVYEIKAIGQVNQAVDKEDLKDEEKSIYYGVIYDGINNSNQLSELEIHGEKFIDAKIDMNEPKTLEDVLRTKYLFQYTMHIIP